MNEKILVTRSSMPSFEEYTKEIKMIWDTHWLTNMGPLHNELERKLIDYLQVAGLKLVTNGHQALELTLQAMELRGEVITSPFTFISTTHSIVRSGLTPVFCDIKADDYTIDPEKIESLITEKTSAIMPIHVYGNICEIAKIESIAKKYNLRVIYDAAHTFGETVNDIGVGAFGDAACFSFHATKVFNTIEGGAICSANKELLDRINRMRDFGIRDEENISDIGTNAKLNEFCAAMGLCNLRHVDEEIRKRRCLVERYMEGLSEVKGIKVNKIKNGVKSNYAYFPIVIDKRKFGKSRDEISEILKQNGIFSRKYFFPLVNRTECYYNLYEKDPTPIATEISGSVLTLPLYADLEFRDVDRICHIIKNQRC